MLVAIHPYSNTVGAKMVILDQKTCAIVPEDGVPTFLPPKIPAKKLPFSSMSGNMGKSFRATWEKRFDLPSSEVLIRKIASFHVPTPLMHAASASFTSSADLLANNEIS